jgi:hypothetical protein
MGGRKVELRCGGNPGRWQDDLVSGSRCKLPCAGSVPVFPFRSDVGGSVPKVLVVPKPLVSFGRAINRAGFGSIHRKGFIGIYICPFAKRRTDGTFKPDN